MEYTKGEWRACGADRGGCSCHMIWSIESACVVAVAIGAKDEDYTRGEGIDDEKVIRANAQHIVDCVNGCGEINPLAAKELYEALKDLLGGIDTGKEVIGFGREKKLRKALLKAEGHKSTYQITQELRQEMREG